eukprot:3762386-Amphidinium_carterae.2
MQDEEHMHSIHYPKQLTCGTCQLADGPVYRHMKIEGKPVDRVHLRMVFMGSVSFLWVFSEDLTKKEKPCMFCDLPEYFQTRHRKDVAAEIEALRIPNIQLGQRIRRLQSDRGPEFFSEELAELRHQRGWVWTTTSSYNPKSNGTAENGIRLVKDLTRRALVHSKMGNQWWSFAVEYVCEAVRSQLLYGKTLPSFGTTVVIRRLEAEGQTSTWKPRGSKGRTDPDCTAHACGRDKRTRALEAGSVPFLDHMSTEESEEEIRNDILRLILNSAHLEGCCWDASVDKAWESHKQRIALVTCCCVYMLLARKRPDHLHGEYTSVQINICDKEGLKPHKDKFNYGLTTLTALGDFKGGELWWLDQNGTIEPPSDEKTIPRLVGKIKSVDNAWIAFDAKQMHAVMPQWEFLVLVWHNNFVRALEFQGGVGQKRKNTRIMHTRTWKEIEMQRFKMKMSQEQEHMWDPRKAQHTNVSPKCVLESKSKERENWKTCVEKELSRLRETGTLEEVDNSSLAYLRNQAKTPSIHFADGTYKSRFVCCGNFTQQVGITNTAELDACVLRMIVTWGVKSGKRMGERVEFATTDVATAFLKAALPPDRIVIVKAPWALTQLGLCKADTHFRIHKALYGLRESPRLLGCHRDKLLKELHIHETSHTKSMKLVQSKVHSSLWFVVASETQPEVHKELDTCEWMNN